MRLFVFLIFLKLTNQAGAAPAACLPRITDDSEIILKSDVVLIATHANPVFDVLKTAKSGVDNTIAKAKARGIPRVYLTQFLDPDYYQDCKPTYWARSQEGEFHFPVKAHHVITVGGFWERCENRSMAEVIRQWKQMPDGNFTLTYVMDSLYMNGDTIRGGDGLPNTTTSAPDAYREAYEHYKQEVSEKEYQGLDVAAISLEKMMSFIETTKEAITFIKRNVTVLGLNNEKELARPNYRVELHFRQESPLIIQTGAGEKAPLLKIEYIDSFK